MVIVACGLLALGVIAFLVSPLLDDRRRWVGTRGDLDDLTKRKDFLYNAMRELNIDFKMGKLSEEDHQQLQAEYMEETSSVLDQLERSTNGKEHASTQIEQAVLEIRKKRAPAREEKEAQVPADIKQESADDVDEEDVVVTSDIEEESADQTTEDVVTTPEKASAKEKKTVAESGLICASCDTENESDAKFCIECGSSLKKKDCASCGAENKNNAKFCAQCGQKV